MNEHKRKEFVELLRKWKVNGLATLVAEEATDEVTTIEVYERQAEGGALMHRFNIHPDLIEVFENADVDGLAFKIIL
jgi:hypothetical protein